MPDKIEIEEIDINDLCEKIMRQTNYDMTTAKEKLKEFNFDIMNVIRDYLKPKPQKQNEPKSLNQKIYKEIRNFMDKVHTNNK